MVAGDDDQVEHNNDEPSYITESPFILSQSQDKISNLQRLITLYVISGTRDSVEKNLFSTVIVAYAFSPFVFFRWSKTSGGQQSLALELVGKAVAWLRGSDIKGS